MDLHFHVFRLGQHRPTPQRQVCEHQIVIRDNDGIIYKPNDSDREGFYEPDSRASAKRFLEQFDDLWARSRPDSELRVLP